MNKPTQTCAVCTIIKDAVFLRLPNEDQILQRLAEPLQGQSLIAVDVYLAQVRKGLVIQEDEICHQLRLFLLSLCSGVFARLEQRPKVILREQTCN